MMRRYPQLYADLSKISDSSVYPRTQFRDYLRALMRADLGKRLMFGSDAAGPGAVTASVAGITSAAFLGPSERRDILCDTAASFIDSTRTPGRSPARCCEQLKKLRSSRTPEHR